MMITVGATSAVAAEPGTSDSVVVNGTTYGPEDGVVVTLDSIPVIPGSEPVGLELGNPYARDTWGSSYAISAEIAYAWYRGTAKAAANVYAGKRIVGVCIWYSQVGRANSQTVCSNASSNGSSWTPGGEVAVGWADNLSDGWPATQFNIRTTRVDPGIY
ncbi:hypothetical protein [Agromyces aureus]|uniref:hypothetical protein n=1 Tax=Agromyces aureus TaxID=453304 RepID=UPI0012603191|nr:hypothetical protein [Agromyces aureus]